METPYRFDRLDMFTREDMRVINQAYDSLPGSPALSRILSTLSDSLMRYDICNVGEMEIGLQVRAVSDIGTPQVLRFTQTLIALGRTAENDVVLKSPLVSKKHAEIFRRGFEVLLRDLKSNNGTYLNKSRLQPGAEVVLKTDDIIRVEPFDISVILPAEVEKKPLEINLVNIRPAKQIRAGSQVALLLNLLPSGQTAMLTMDREAARWLIRKVITGQKESGLPGWTEIESGLFEYLACQMIAVLNPFLKPTRLLLQGIESQPGSIESWIGAEQSMVELTFGAHTEMGMLYAVLYMKAPAAETSFKTAHPISMLEKAPWLKNLTYDFSINLGVSTLASNQIAALEEGDVILLDNAGVTLDSNCPTGRVELRCKNLQRGTIRGSLNCNANGYSSITVEKLDQEGLKRMTEANKKSDGDQPQAGNEEVLSSLEVPITIEFARVLFTLEELAAVKEGQIIEMEKMHPELVDLSVDGKVIGSGKLVDVEGKLGVRILKMVKGR